MQREKPRRIFLNKLIVAVYISSNQTPDILFILVVI